MTPVLIELNDAGINVGVPGAAVITEPGYALLDGRGLIVGEAAASRARVAPQLVSHRYWDTLDQDTLPSEGAWRRTPAEVAYEQLTGLWNAAGGGDQSAIVLVPATFTRAQLGLILGMCRKAGIRVESLIDSALAALASAPDARQAVVIDATLHRISGVRLSIDENITRRATAELDQFGLMDYRRRFAATMADICVRATRYDPMHSAESEQALYDSLDDVLTRLHDAARIQWQVDVANEQIGVDVARAEMADAVTNLNGQVDQLVADLVDPALGAPSIYVTHRLDFGPDVTGALATSFGGVHVLPKHAALDGVVQDLATFMQDGAPVGLITQRPRRGVDAREVVSKAPVAKHDPATHILVADRIYRLSSRPFLLGTATTEGDWGHRASGSVKGVSRRHCSIELRGERIVLRDSSSYGTWVNGRRVDGETTLGDGDIIRMGNPGLELRIVREGLADG